MPDGLTIWLKEKETKSLMEAAELADTYTYTLAREDSVEGASKETTPLGTAPSWQQTGAPAIRVQ